MSEVEISAMGHTLDISKLVRLEILVQVNDVMQGYNHEF